MSAFTYGSELFFWPEIGFLTGMQPGVCLGIAERGGVEGQLPAGLAGKGWDQHWMAALVR